ncbi:hypothetical protein [Amycolatopsis jiangsuensis]|uniref:Putative membrane-bound spermidine synthase n=1 Tax=Amycolatopsis jiangsuensis TaxID=1181879 RepID=A0A840J366_9PSEU|nr:hypothetical protein [Amycolatopsis jiangsuensis]MBB4688159.1 putative membrane-bound spermidine synthase [Amycolatopsis jiangsuensis]
MKTARFLLVLPGLAALAYGVVLFLEYAAPAWPDSFTTVVWIGGGPIVNDAVFAPLAGVAGLLLARVLPRPWRTPVQVGALLTAVLGFLAFPLLWRAYGVAPQPGLHDGDTWLGLLLTVAAVWVAVLLTGTARTVTARRARRREDDLEQQSSE